MCQVREKSWVPKLRAAVKVVDDCNTCRRNRVGPLAAKELQAANIPAYRAEFTEAFFVTGDTAGPVYHKTGKN